MEQTTFIVKQDGKERDDIRFPREHFSLLGLTWQEIILLVRVPWSFRETKLQISLNVSDVSLMLRLGVFRVVDQLHLLISPHLRMEFKIYKTGCIFILVSKVVSVQTSNTCSVCSDTCSINSKTRFYAKDNDISISYQTLYHYLTNHVISNYNFLWLIP